MSRTKGKARLACAFMLIVSMCLSSIGVIDITPRVAKALTPYSEGIPGTLFYEEENNKIVIKGYEPNDRDEGDVLEIPSTIGSTPVGSISVEAFSGDAGIREIKIPTSITAIPARCFQYNGRIEVIDLPNTLTSIGDNAFDCAVELKTIKVDGTENNNTLPSSLTSIGERAFYVNNAMRELHIPNNVTRMGDWAVSFMDKLETLTLSNAATELTQICPSCSKLKEIVIPEGVTKIDGCFRDCPALEKAYIPATMTSVEGESFLSNSSLLTFYVANGASGLKLNKDGVTGRGEDGLLLGSDFVTIYSNDDSGENMGKKLADAFNIPFKKVSSYSDITAIAPTSARDSNFSYSYMTSTNGNGVDSTICRIDEYKGSGSEVTIPATIGGKTVTLLKADLFSENDNITRVNVQANVTALPRNCFYNMENLRSVTLPSTLTYIGSCAFLWTAISSISIPDSVKYIEGECFQDCKYLSDVHIPTSLTKVGGNAFGECVSLESIDFSGVTNKVDFEDGVFRDCDNLKKIILPNTMGDTIEYDMFRDCRSLQTIRCKNDTSNTLPSSVEHIRSGAFYGCTELASLDLPSSVESIGMDCFGGCYGLRALRIQNSSIKYNENDAFDSTNGDPGFSDCTYLTLYASASPGTSGLTVANPSAYQAISYTDNTVGDVRYLIYGDEAYVAGNNNVSSITIPSTISSGGSKTVKGIFHLSHNTLVLDSDSDNDVYQNTITDITVEAGVTRIPEGFAEGYTALKSVSLPESVTIIEDKAFYKTGALTDFTLPKNVISLGDQAFYMSKSLEWVMIDDSLKTIGSEAFSQATSLEWIDFGSSLETIGESAFEGCNTLKNASLPDGFTALKDRAFADCSIMTGIYLPVSLQENGFGEGVFDGDPLLSISSVSNAYAKTYAENNGKHFIDISFTGDKDEEIKDVDAKIDDDVLKNIKESDGGELDIETNGTSVIFDEEAVENIFDGLDEEQDENISFTQNLVSNSDENSMSEGDYKDAISGIRSRGGKVIDFFLRGQSNKSIEFGRDGRGKVTIRIPFIMPTDRDYRYVLVFYINEQGIRQEIRATYDKQRHFVEFETTHFSTYALDPSDTPSALDDNTSGGGSSGGSGGGVSPTATPAATPEASESPAPTENPETTVTTDEDGNIVTTTKETLSDGTIRTTVVVSDPNTGEVKSTTITEVKGSVKKLVSYKVISAKKKAVSLTGSTTSAKTQTLTVPATVKINGVKYKITSIADNAFKNNKKLTKVTIGKYVTTIGKNAFRGCTKLKSVKLGKAVTTIKAGAFYGDKNLKVIDIYAAKLKKVGKNAFKGVSKKVLFRVHGTKKQYKKAVKLIKKSGGIPKNAKFVRVSK